MGLLAGELDGIEQLALLSDPRCVQLDFLVQACPVVKRVIGPLGVLIKVKCSKGLHFMIRCGGNGLLRLVSGDMNGVGPWPVIGYAFEFGANGCLIMFLFGMEGELSAFMSVGIELFLNKGFRNGTGILIRMVPGVVAELLEVDDGAVLAFVGVVGEFVGFGKF